MIEVPVYTTIRTLTNAANSVKSITLTAINPDIVKYYAKNEDGKLYLMLTFNLFLTGFLCKYGIGLINFLYRPYLFNLDT